MSLVDKIKNWFSQKEHENNAAINSAAVIVTEPIEPIREILPPNGNLVAHNSDTTTPAINGISHVPANEQERAAFLDKLSLVLNLAAEHPLELNICNMAFGQLYHDPYQKADQLAWRGKDPREALAEIHSSTSSVELDLFSDKIPEHQAQQFRYYVLLKTADIMQKPGMNYSSFELQRIYQSLSEEEKDRIRELLKEAYAKFVKSTSQPLSPKRENEILKAYDSRRYENNIPRLLKEARAKARAGDVGKTLDELAKVERNAAGDWTEEIFDVYKLAYRVNFDSAINKAEREFVKQRAEKGMRYLKEAEMYAHEIGIPLRANNPSSVRSHLNPKAFRNYQQYIDTQKEIIDLQRERIKILYSITAHCQSKEGVN